MHLKQYHARLVWYNIKFTLAIAAWASFVTFVFGGSASLTMRHTTADGKFRSSGRSAIFYNELKLLKSERCLINININTLAEESGKKTTTYIAAELRAKFKLLDVILEMGLIDQFWKTFAKFHWVSWSLLVISGYQWNMNKYIKQLPISHSRKLFSIRNFI